MKAIVAAVGLGILGAGAALDAAQEPPPSPKPRKEHEWLQQLVGEWDSETEITTDPAKPPAKHKGKESGRMIGGFWAVTETKAEFMGAPFTGIMTLGYDEEKKKYVGTWIDSVTGHLWLYQGAVDAAGRMIALDAEGPGHDGKLARFRETIEIKDKDHKVFTSSIEKDGKWITFLTARMERRK